MSSPADGLPYSQADFLARWMPSSTRAGVILHPSPDLAGSLRHISAVEPPSLQPDDSFISDFAPLPASTDSSCIGVDGVNGLSSAPAGITNGECHPLDSMTAKSQDLPLIMKLEQLRKWQQHMQEQLKAHQLEELLRLQEEQQRLLGHMNGSQHCKEEAANSGMSETEWGKDTLHGASHYNQYSPSRSCGGVPQGSSGGFRHVEAFLSTGRQEQLSEVQNDEEEDFREDPDTVDIDYCSGQDDRLTQSNSVTTAEDRSRKVNDVFSDRPIKPGIGGQKQTFEELLEEQLRLEEQRLQFVHQQQIPDKAKAANGVSQRPYLKRGEGLARFTKNHKGLAMKKDPKPQPQASVISRSNSEPISILKVSANNVPRLPVQRKTAVLNKENRLRGLTVPPQDIRADGRPARTKVLGNRQQPNTDGPECSQTDSERRLPKQLQLRPRKEQSNAQSVQASRSSGHNLQPNPVTKQVGMLGRPGQSENNSFKSCGSKVELAGGNTNSRGEIGAPRDSVEVSFQERLQRWEYDQELEFMELGEFELLEQAAEELSFSSNSSFVMKVLQMDQQRKPTVLGLHQRRLSSTPIKSPPRRALRRCSSVGNNNALGCQGIPASSEAFAVHMRADALNAKTMIEEKVGPLGETEDKKTSAASSSSSSEFGDNEIAVESALSFHALFNPPYNKRSYQDEDSVRDSASDVEQEDGGGSDSVLSNADDSTLVEERDVVRGRVVFDDDDTWNDLEDTATGTDKDSKESSPASKQTAGLVLPSEEKLIRKLAGSKAVQPDEQLIISPVSLEPDTPPPPPPPPPPSQLMTRLFPSLKPKAQNAPAPHPSTGTVAKNPTVETAQQVQSMQLRERLVQLEIEIERFKKENAALTKLRQENEKAQESLRKARLEFEQSKAEELAQFEEHQREEHKKLQRERKLFETHVLAARALPDKKEREEIQVLKQQLTSLQEELKRRESRWSATHSRQRQQIDSLSQENSSLHDEICMLEKLRLSAWKKSPAAAAEKEPQTKDSPRVCESNNVPSVTKGVTFASPLASRGSSSSPPQSSTAARRPSRDTTQTAAGIKSSLRKPAGTVSSSSSSSSSSSLPSRTTEERSAVQEKPPTQEHSHSSSPEPESAEATEPESAREVITHPDGKVEKVLVGGDRLIIFPNGTRKEVSADGQSVKVTFFNGDTKQVTADQRVIYYYAEAKTTHVTYPDGMEVLHFPNNQTEKHFPDGRKEITFPDQTVKNLFPNGREESVLTDGTIIQVNLDGTKEIHFNTGQKEIHTADYKRREYPDGTVKTVYTDGRQETCYPTGRVRVKDKDGKVILDNMA